MHQRSYTVTRTIDQIVSRIPRHRGVTLRTGLDATLGRRRRMTDSFAKGEAVVMKGSGKIGDVIESDEDMTLVEWRNGSESRVATSRLEKFKSSRDRMTDAIDAAVAGIPDRRRRARDADREPNQGDLDAAARGLRMTGMSPSELDDLAREHEGKPLFASKVIYLAAKQMAAAKRRMGARDVVAAVDAAVAGISDRRRRARDAFEGPHRKVETVNGWDIVEVGAGGYAVQRPGSDRPIKVRTLEEARKLAKESRGDAAAAVDAVVAGIPDRRARDDLAKPVTKKQLSQKLLDGEWESSVDIVPAIEARRAIEVRETSTGKRFWVRVTDEGPSGSLSEAERRSAGRVGSEHREEEPEGAFLEPASRKYPVKEKRDGVWKYDRGLLVAAARRARMEGNEALAKRADAIREREFGGAADAIDRIVSKMTRRRIRDASANEEEALQVVNESRRQRGRSPLTMKTWRSLSAAEKRSEFEAAEGRGVS